MICRGAHLFPKPLTTATSRSGRYRSPGEPSCRTVDRRCHCSPPAEGGFTRTEASNERGQAGDISHPLQSSQHDRNAPRKKHQILSQAEQELANYCAALPGDESAEQCWDAYRYFEDKKGEVQEGCSLEEAEGSSGPECQKLERFEGFVRELVGEGHVANLAHTMGVAGRIEYKKKHMDEGTHVEPGETFMATESLDLPDDRRERIVALFHALDVDANGKLDTGEFRAAMSQLGDELSGEAVSQIFQAMDIHGWIELDQFISIVEAEAVVSHSSIAAALRRLHTTAKWWSREDATSSM